MVGSKKWGTLWILSPPFDATRFQPNFGFEVFGSIPAIVSNKDPRALSELIEIESAFDNAPKCAKKDLC